MLVIKYILPGMVNEAVRSLTLGSLQGNESSLYTRMISGKEHLTEDNLYLYYWAEITEQVCISYSREDNLDLYCRAEITEQVCISYFPRIII